MSYWSRINLGLMVLSIILAASLYWPTGHVSAERLTTRAGDSVTSIRVERGRRLILSLQRGADGWRMDHPQEASAADRRVQRLLSILDAPVLQRILPDHSTADYGLDEPRGLIRFDDVDIRFGNPDLSHQLRYVGVGDDISVIDDAFFTLLTLPASHYIEP